MCLGMECCSVRPPRTQLPVSKAGMQWRAMRRKWVANFWADAGGEEIASRTGKTSAAEEKRSGGRLMVESTME